MKGEDKEVNIEGKEEVKVEYNEASMEGKDEVKGGEEGK